MSDDILASFLAPLSSSELDEIHRQMAAQTCCVICAARLLAKLKLEKALAACPCRMAPSQG
jgi:hypothetical protein